MSRDDGLEGQALLNYHLKRMKEDQECEATTYNRQNSAYSQAVYEDRNIVSQMVNRGGGQVTTAYNAGGFDGYSSKTNILAGPKTFMADDNYYINQSDYNVGAMNIHQSETDLDHRLKYEGKKIHIGV